VLLSTRELILFPINRIAYCFYLYFWWWIGSFE